MRKLIDKIFVYMYTWHYERNNNNPNIDPTGIASWTLGVGVGLWLVCIYGAGSIIFNYDSISKYAILTIAVLALIAGGLFHNYYLNDNRALKLYNEYKDSLNVKSPIDGILRATLFMLVPLALLGVFMLLFSLLKK